MTRLLAAGLALLGGTAVAYGADHPVAGQQLGLERTPRGERLVLVLADASIPVPPPGGGDDPTVAGLTLVLFGGTSGAAIALGVPPGLGTPGWSVGTTRVTRYTFTNRDAPAGPSVVRVVRLRDGKGVKIVAREVGLPLAAPEGRIGVRVEIGGTRVCAVFEGGAVRRDGADVFLARNAPAPATASCADGVLLGTPCEDSAACDGPCAGDGVCAGAPGFGCVCASPSQPCGDTAPVCNGQCPAGEACADIGGVPFPSCGCLPAGSTPCGTVDPVCGDGDCPPGLGCFLDTFRCCGDVEITGCACLAGPPPPPCGGTCPPGWTCVQQPGQPEFCIPPFCSGGSGAPVCDGSCAAGATCLPVSGICFCLTECDGGGAYPVCGGSCADPGLVCRANEVVGRCICQL